MTLKKIYLVGYELKKIPDMSTWSSLVPIADERRRMLNDSSFRTVISVNYYYFLFTPSSDILFTFTIITINFI